MKGRWIPIAAAILALMVIGRGFRPEKPLNGFDIHAFGRLPVVDQGRVKPLDTLARTSLMFLSTKQTFYTDGASGTVDRDRAQGMEKSDAIRFFLDVASRSHEARTYEVIRIDHPDVLGLLGMSRDRKYFSVAELLQHGEELDRQIQSARAVESRNQTGFQRKILQLSQRLNSYFYIEDASHLLLVPPDTPGGEWGPIAGADHNHAHPGAGNGAETPTGIKLTAAFLSWAENDPATFNAAVADYASWLKEALPESQGRLGAEKLFYRIAPFVQSMGLYVLAFILAVLSWLGWGKQLSRAALVVLVLGVIIHSGGLIARIYIQNRPPVTNLYSSALFVGWGAVLLGAVLERWFANGVGAVVGAVMGFSSLLVAHHLSLDGDTMTMMQAVLDTNFWLATHVVVITLGYSATYLAGLLGVVFILRGVLTKGFGEQESKSLSRMIYGVVCFATLFSFVGTILGGIWADQSWGRFWGWDPKENGALLIVLWNALVLHARWGGMARDRGLAALAVFGNVVTTWSWFGTNMLGVGLHAYGFIDSALFWMTIFILSQFAIIGLGMIPRHRWRSPGKLRTKKKAA